MLNYSAPQGPPTRATPGCCAICCWARGWGEVNYPKGDLHLERITLTPSGALLPVHPYSVRIGRPVDCLRGAVQPVNVPETPTIPPTSEPKWGACLSLSPALGTPLAVTP